MNEGLIPKRYAKALYMVASEQGNDGEVYEQMQALEGAFAAEPALQTTMSNPFVTATDKEQLVLMASNATAEAKILVDFVKLLEQNRRIGMLRDIAIAYLKIYRQEHKLYKVEVTSAEELSAKAQDRLRKLIETHLAGGTAEISYTTDPGLIGGFTVKIDNERLDASIKNELSNLKKILW